MESLLTRTKFIRWENSSLNPFAMYDHKKGSGSFQIHRKRQKEEEARIKRKKEEAAAQHSSTENLSLSEPEDVSEKEADSIAKKVANGQNAELPNNNSSGTNLQRKSEGEQSQVNSDFSSQLNSSKGSGRPMDDATRSEMESKMGTDFSDVKIHTGSNAHAMNENVNAKAFAHGQDVYFKNGNYNPNSSEGKELLAHELVHTKQQENGKVRTQIQRAGGKTLSYDTTKEDLTDPGIIKQIDALKEAKLFDYSQNCKDADVRLFMLDKLTEKYPDLPTIAELVHFELTTITPPLDAQKIFVNLQKLKTDAKINELKGIYNSKFGATLEADLRAKLSDQELQLALELIKIKATKDQVDLIKTVPITEDDYTKVAARLNEALTNTPALPQVVFATLIPFNRDNAKLSKLEASYKLYSPDHHTLEDDIRTFITNTNQQSYALYLLFAPPPGVPLEDTGGVTKTGTQEFDEQVKGGRVTANTGVDFDVKKAGYSIGYKGALASDSRWLQFIWREVTYWIDVGGTLVEQKFASPASGIGANLYYLTTSKTNIQYSVDSAPPPSTPFYEAAFADNRTVNSTTMYDAPSSNQGLVTMLFGPTYKAKKAVIAAHFNTYLIRDFSPITRVNVDVEYVYNTATDTPAPSYSNAKPTATPVTELDPNMKAVLDKQYNKKYSYIR